MKRFLILLLFLILFSLSSTAQAKGYLSIGGGSGAVKQAIPVVV